MQPMKTAPKLLRITIPLAVALAACQPLQQPANTHLTAIDYWPEEHMLFVAVPQSGAVDVLRVPESPRQGALDFVDRLAEPSRHDIVRCSRRTGAACSSARPTPAT